ncbi:uncharacterized protein LOC118646172 isoform X2 [Monomorium pharaonis]|uniref:uncharacterized protein LOC118646172 isoform X2 n=1 Tax=Monomorium pharaonis TaxID=307658 RepID=UPI00174733C3|nr:uncharacterized protein LOC118646172 isoform X2 [Monomorium pharaonis]
MGRKINGKRLHLSRPRRSTKKAWIKRILLCPTFSDARWMLAPYSVPCVWSSGSKSLLLAARLHSLARSAAPRFLCPRQAVSRPLMSSRSGRYSRSPVPLTIPGTRFHVSESSLELPERSGHAVSCRRTGHVFQFLGYVLTNTNGSH